MQQRIKLGGFLLLLSAVFFGLSCQTEQQESTEHPDADEHYEGSVPLIYHMSFMQRYSHKLYLAGIEENWELADIYSHEIEELSEGIIKGKHMDDGVNLSKLLKTMLIPQIENVEAAIDAKDRAMFESRYQTMIQTCNQCHQAANYGLVKVTVPDSNPFNQDFSLPAGE